MNYDYDNAIRYLSIAQTLLNGLGSSAKYSGALRALRECYERLNKPDKMQICSDRIAEVSARILECSKVCGSVVLFPLPNQIFNPFPAT